MTNQEPFDPTATYKLRRNSLDKNAYKFVGYLFAPIDPTAQINEMVTDVEGNPIDFIMNVEHNPKKTWNTTFEPIHRVHKNE